RSPEPAPEPADLAACPDEAALKRALAAKAPRGTPPRQIDEQCRAVLAAREICHTLDRVAATGARAVYRSVDARDAAAVARAAANEALNKVAQAEARRRPGCRVVAVNWGPWAGGMVTPALRQVFAAEGIGLIPLAAGARHLLAEITAPDHAVEVVVLGGG